MKFYNMNHAPFTPQFSYQPNLLVNVITSNKIKWNILYNNFNNLNAILMFQTEQNLQFVKTAANLTFNQSPFHAGHGCVDVRNIIIFP